jgi:DNA polymerase-3 subunit epsilon
MKLPKNFVVIDCETSGLSPERHALLSIGAVTVSGREFYREVLFDETKEIDPEAMKVNGLDLTCSSSDDVWPEQAVRELIDWLGEEHAGRWIYGGRNPAFDWGFLTMVAEPSGLMKALVSRISRRAIDQHSLAYWWALQRGIDMTAGEFGTDTIYRALGFEPEPRPHTAIQGARLEMAVFRALAAAIEG